MKIITLLFVFLSLTVYSQERINEAEHIIFDMVNNYRVSQGLEPVKWSNNVYGAAYHHSSYVSFVKVKNRERVISVLVLVNE